jgi:hypothetical protein
MDPDPGGPKTCGSGSGTLVQGQRESQESPIGRRVIEESYQNYQDGPVCVTADWNWKGGVDVGVSIDVWVWVTARRWVKPTYTVSLHSPGKGWEKRKAYPEYYYSSMGPAPQARFSPFPFSFFFFSVVTPPPAINNWWLFVVRAAPYMDLSRGVVYVYIRRSFDTFLDTYLILASLYTKQLYDTFLFTSQITALGLQYSPSIETFAGCLYVDRLQIVRTVTCIVSRQNLNIKLSIYISK